MRRQLARSGFQDEPAITPQAIEGELPHGRELSFAWLAGTVMTGLTSVLLMGATLYVSFKGQDNFSTASAALELVRGDTLPPAGAGKSDRLRQVARTRSDVSVLAASIQATEDGRTIVRSQQFTRLDATLVLSETPLGEKLPPFDPLALAAATEEVGSTPAPQLYSATAEGEVAIRLQPLAASFAPVAAVSDTAAVEFVRSALQEAFFEAPADPAMAYAAQPAATSGRFGAGAAMGIAENLTVVSRTPPERARGGRSERIVTVRQAAPLGEVLRRNGFGDEAASQVGRSLANVLPGGTLPVDAKLRILLGPSRASPVPIPYRLSIYFHDRASGEVRHAATAALTDRGGYVVGQAPAAIAFPAEDTEAPDVGALPTLYRSLWETIRRNDLGDDAATRAAAIFAYEVDLTQKVAPGDEIRLLTTRTAAGESDLLYAALTTGGTTRELFRFQNADGSVDYYGPDGTSGKRFLLRRPVENGGRLSSRYGYRTHPIFKTRRLHSGVDLAAPSGTPIYAGGDGKIDIAGWTGGYGRYVAIDHVNGFRTTYAHMSRIAPGIRPGARVRQGQLIGFVGSTGNSTGNHLHYEMLVNGRTVDPLSIKLPRDKQLPAQAQLSFERSRAEIRELMARNASEAPP